MLNFTRVQCGTTKDIKTYIVNGVEMTRDNYNNKFDEANRDSELAYNSSATKRNIKTGDYIHTAIFS